MIAILNNFRHRTGTRGRTACRDVGCKPTSTTATAVLDPVSTTSPNLESVNKAATKASSLWVANPQGLVDLYLK